VLKEAIEEGAIRAGDEFRVNTTTASEQRYSSVATLADGEFVITRTSDGPNPGIYAQRYDANGQPVGDNNEVIPPRKCAWKPFASRRVETSRSMAL
jgi:hypothetical protein